MNRMHIWRATQSARKELQVSEATKDWVIFFDSASPEKSCFVVNLDCSISPCLRAKVVVFLNAIRKNEKLPQFASKGEKWSHVIR